MNPNLFKKAVKRDAKLRFAACGAAGSGKTFTLLKLATELGGPIAYVDTEHGSASKYAHTDKCSILGSCTDPSHFDFDVIEPHSYDPRELGQFIDTAVENGYRVICCDSLSHYWMGVGGELDLVDAKAKTESGKGNSFTAWKTVTPLHNALVDKLLSAPIHVLVAMRTKTEWVLETNDKGKNVPRKIGMAPIMRDGIEFEFDVCGDLDQDNNLVITKTRCSALTGKVINRPGKEMADILREWLAGAPAEVKAGTNGNGNGTVPEELKLIFQKLGEPGGVAAGINTVKGFMAAQTGVDTAAADFKTLCEKHSIQPKGNDVGKIKALLLDMFKNAEAARVAAASTTITDDDVPF